jgi:hypothetical protein
MSTLQEELQAEFAKHDLEYGVAQKWCSCSWKGESWSAHLAEIATRITNARVEGLIREAAEAGFRMSRPFGEPEFGVVYPVLRGDEPSRVAAFNHPDSKTEAESFLKFWKEKGEKAFLVTRVWRRVE